MGTVRVGSEGGQDMWKSSSDYICLQCVVGRSGGLGTALMDCSNTMCYGWGCDGYVRYIS